MDGGASAPRADGLDTHTMAVFLEEIQYFLEDMQKDVWWLLQFAHQPTLESRLVLGSEELVDIAGDTQATIERMRDRADVHAENHASQVRAKIVLIPSVSAEEREVLHGLKRLKFNCGGRIEVFPCMKEANNAAIWAAYHNSIGSQQPQWMVRTDSPGKKLAFAQCVVVVPVWVDEAKQDIKLFNVWCPEKKKRHWAFVGGDCVRGTDRNLFDAARREWNSEVGGAFNRTWDECFRSELPTDWCEELPESDSCMLYNILEKDGVTYPCRPHFLMQVTEDFYEATRAYEDASGVIKMPDPEGAFVRWDDPPGTARRVHLEGVRFVDRDEARWVSLEFMTGKMTADDANRPQLRKENVHLLQSRPERIWAFLSRLLGVDPPERVRQLPADFNAEGPFAVRVSGIDKTATDENIVDFFEEAEIKVKSVKQFPIPKHTARVDLDSVESLETALAMSQRFLLRRKVKVELWSDADDAAAGGNTEEAEGARPLKEYDGPLPNEPPFNVRCRGLDRAIQKNDLGYFFWDRNCTVSEVVYPLKGEKHQGIVEFADVESLRRALSLNGAIFSRREITIELLQKGDENKFKEEKPGKGRDKGGFGGGGGGREFTRGSKGGGGGKGSGGGGFGGGGGGREPPSRSEFGSERPKLNLQPRSRPLDQVGGYPSAGAGAGASQPGKSDPFGGARPREERFKPTRADHDDNWRR